MKGSTLIMCVAAVGSLSAALCNSQTLKTDSSGSPGEIDYTQIVWEIGEAKTYDAVEHAFNGRKLAASDGRKIVVVPITYRVRNGQSPVGEVKVGNLYFSAWHDSDVPREGAAIAIGRVNQSDMWFIPEAGEGKTFGFDVSKFPEHTVSVAFAIPSEWDSFRVHFACPIGATKPN